MSPAAPPGTRLRNGHAMRSYNLELAAWSRKPIGKAIYRS